MHHIAGIFFISFGIAAIILAVVHEVYWWRRRWWSRSKGMVKGFKEGQSSDSGPSYFAEIEFEVNGVVRTFCSQYGSGRKPAIGDAVPIVVNAAGDEAAEISRTHRVLIPAASLVVGVIFVIVGLNIQPIGEQEKGGKPAVIPESE